MELFLLHISSYLSTLIENLRNFAFLNTYGIEKFNISWALKLLNLNT